MKAFHLSPHLRRSYVGGPDLGSLLRLPMVRCFFHPATVVGQVKERGDIWSSLCLRTLNRLA